MNNSNIDDHITHLANWMRSETGGNEHDVLLAQARLFAYHAQQFEIAAGILRRRETEKRDEAAEQSIDISKE